MEEKQYNLLTLAYICYLTNDFTQIIDETNKLKHNTNDSISVCLDCSEIGEVEKTVTDEKSLSYSIADKFKIAKYILSLYLKKINIKYSILSTQELGQEELEQLQDDEIEIVVVGNQKVRN